MDSLSLIRKCSTEQAYQFIHATIDDICHRKGPFVTGFVPDIWTEDEYFVALKAWKQFVLKMIDVRSKNEVNLAIGEDLQKVVYECIEIRRAEIKNAMVGMVISDSCPLVLTDFDWHLKMILSSDKMSEMNMSLVDVDLALNGGIQQNGEAIRKVVSFEMNKEELKKLIHSLEEAQNAVNN